MIKASPCKQTGFNLLEVLLALFIVALVIGMATQVVGTSIRNTTAMQESTFARWVGFNQIEWYKIKKANSEVLPALEEGEEEMGNMKWHWVREVGNSSAADIAEIKVKVYREGKQGDEDPVAVVKGYTEALN